MSVHSEYGKIFVMQGTSSAGKSSIVNALREKDPSWVEVGYDLTVMSHMADMIRETFPSEYEQMSKGLSHTEIGHAVVDVFYNEKEGREINLSFLRWKDGNYSKQEILNLARSMAANPAFVALDQSMFTKETAQVIENKMRDFIRVHSEQGHPVFVDGLWPDMLEAFHTKLDVYPIQMGLTYLPLHYLTDRVTKRNETAKKTGDSVDVRSYTVITNQFLEFFKRAEGDEPVIGHMSLAKIEKAFSQMKPQDEEETQELRDLKTRIIEEYRLSGGERVPLASRVPYSVLVKTKQAPEESAQQILGSYKPNLA